MGYGNRLILIPIDIQNTKYKSTKISKVTTVQEFLFSTQNSNWL